MTYDENYYRNNTDFRKLMVEFFSYAKSKLRLETTPKLKFIYDEENAKDPLGKTGHYDPQTDTLALYVIGRYPKDILRTAGHELVHKHQHQNEMFNIANESTEEGYAQKNPNLRRAEKDANMRGSMLLRDWEDHKKYGT